MFDPSFKGVGQRVGLEIWRIENFKVVLKDKKDPCYKGHFHTGDSYIVLHTNQRSNALERHIHFWLGKETSQDEAGCAAYKTVELDTSLGGEPVQHREMQVSVFLSSLPVSKRTQVARPGAVVAYALGYCADSYSLVICSFYILPSRVTRVMSLSHSSPTFATSRAVLLQGSKRWTVMPLRQSFFM